MTPLRFCFAIHLHQPVGNFDSVFADHLRDVYRPLLQRLMDGEAWPVTMHLSGPLLDWLEINAADFVDTLGDHVATGHVELLAAGHDEPILAVLSRDDRVEQVVRHREHLQRRFGVDATGLWLTERVWEPTLPEDLVAAGIRYALVDDRHFRVAGFQPDQLHAHFRTESGGHQVTLFPISEQLRYLVPFRPAAEIAGHLRDLHQDGRQLAVLGDDGEKFGGWPGTREWVYESGWMDDFLAAMRDLRDNGAVVFSTFEAALALTPSAGIAYLPSASYREMEGWSLPPVPARALLRLEHAWDGDRLQGVEGGLLRGSHWRNFFAKYAESNRLHKAVMAVSALARRRGDPVNVRRWIGRAQCNDAYWHGVFGGIYLPFLRSALWTNLAMAEAALRDGEPLEAEVLDFDSDGHDEVWIHSSRCGVLVAPARGGAVEMLLDFASGQNLVDVMTRYPEAYHEPLDGLDTDSVHGSTEGGAPSIHDLEGQLTELPPVDREHRALFVDRVVEADTTIEDFIAGRMPVLLSWAGERLTHDVTLREGGAVVTMRADDFTKVITVAEDGAVSCAWTWTVSDDDIPGAWFTTELSVAADVVVSAPGAEVWEYPIDTVAKSEKGFDRLQQGVAYVYRWPLSAGSAELSLKLAGR